MNVDKTDIGKEKNVVDLEKHRALWNTVVSGAPTDALAAAGKLYELGEMSEKTFNIFVLATAMAATKKKEGNQNET